MKGNKETAEALNVHLKKSVYGQTPAIDALCDAMAAGAPGVILAGGPGLGKTLILRKVQEFACEHGCAGEEVPMITCVVPAGIERQLGAHGNVAKALESNPAAILGFDAMGLADEPVREKVLGLLAEPVYVTESGKALSTEQAFVIITTALTKEEMLASLEKTTVREAVEQAWLSLQMATQEQAMRFLDLTMHERARPIRVVCGAKVTWDQETLASVCRKVEPDLSYVSLKLQVSRMMGQLLSTVLDCDYTNYHLDVHCCGYVAENNQFAAEIKATKKEGK